MHHSLARNATLSLLAALALLGACAGGDEAESTTGAATGDPSSEVPGSREAVDASLLTNAARPLTVTSGVACTLGGGTATTCVTIKTQSLPAHNYGPFCSGGIWQGKTINAEANECTLEGKVKGCLECAVEAQDILWTIPSKPVPAKTTTALDAILSRSLGVGVALNGVSIFRPDPDQKLVSQGNQAPVDPCGGHAGFANDYHYHRIPSCLVKDTAGEHSPLLGYAIDGYGLYGTLGEDGKAPTDLDECQGHTHGALGYHYHAKNEWPYFVACFKGAIGASTNGKGSGPPPGGM